MNITFQTGVFYIEASGKKKQKQKVSCGDNEVIYDISGKHVLPLQFGNGKYVFQQYENTRSNLYALKQKRVFDINFNNEDSAFLKYNDFVPCNADIVAMAQNLTEDENPLPGQRWKAQRIKDFISHNISYDYVRAVTKPQGLPDPVRCLKKKKGICQDIASLTAAMLREANIPAKLVIGYADKKYHAWNEVKIDDKWELWDLSVRKQAKEYKKERFY